MATLLRVTIDPAYERTALLSLQSRVEGAVALLDRPVVISRGANFLEVQLADALPAEELNSVIKAISTLVGRPGSGILGDMTLTPDSTAGTPRSYSV